MQKTSKLLWSCIAGVSAIVCFNGVNAAPSRSLMGTSDTGAGRAATTTARMPTMPTMSINTIGTHAISGVTLPTNTAPTPTPTPEPNPGPQPTPSADCPDGGVRNSDFTVQMCMDSIFACINGGALPNGINTLFNEDLRNSIFNGMGVCASEVDACIRNVRIDCENVYNSAQDVWLDFNSRVVQPQYYDFVLRKTGLTPNQAENVCGLLDKNTYGKSFAAVSASGNVTSEYNNTINAYNENGGTKPQPQGATVNTTANGNLTGVDGERGHYARWDATNAVCKVRVAAYNKNDLITNKWLFGALGDDKAAEVWQDAGSTFTCNKDLFDFSLMNDTHTAAVVGMGGGTLLGAGIGALAGHGARDFDCNNSTARSDLLKELNKNSKNIAVVNKYLKQEISGTNLSEEQCESVVDLYNRYMLAKKAKDMCAPTKGACSIPLDGSDGSKITVQLGDDCSGYKGDTDSDLFRFENGKIQVRASASDGWNNLSEGNTDANKAAYAQLEQCMKACKENRYASTQSNCSFHTLVNGGVSFTSDDWNKAVCDGGVATCVEKSVIESQIDELDKIFAKGTVLQGQESNRLKTTLTGAGIGLGAGGVATAITAFVERNNISCHVGDGLNTVGFGKSFTIDTLKEFYVKWNLRVADSISPTARVTSCKDWINTCGMYTTEEECRAVAINYQAPGRTTTTTIRGACRMAGSVCVENRATAVSFGACTWEDVNPNVGGGTVTPTPAGNPVLIQH